ncbi:MAG: UDP-N-acetylglucosamine 2-epimerase (non-hydrolyzing) [Candidatus Omnitrophica bacterium]|nr:UDP-N-acetylglucosamine 2-epimerase (non-hydrolyzing) [Candidatus Omnitrophota bacterium]
MTKRKKIGFVFGTRPEAIKLAPLYLAFKEHPARFDPRLWITGQHREMLDQVMTTFSLSADRDFKLMKENQTLAHVTTAVIENLVNVFERERPDLVVVQGDTTTVFASALASFYERIPVGHVEAGLRTWDKYSPYPEEVNRQLATRLAELHFAPTESARANLLAERIESERIYVTGNTVIDALDIVVNKVRKLRPPLPTKFPIDQVVEGRRMILITGHRRENFGRGFESICQAISSLAKQFPDCDFVYPVHLNPHVQEPVRRELGNTLNIHLVEPLSYEAFVWAMDKSYIILSDSGGVQEEAPHLGKPVLVMRSKTERPEAVEAGTSILVGTDHDTIVNAVTRLLKDVSTYESMSQATNPYGDGQACKRIVDAVAAFFGLS